MSARLIGGAVAPAAEWSARGTTAVIGTLLGQLFGNALHEELVYRGFLFTQVLFRLRQRWPGSGHRPLVMALLMSQALFATRHIPSVLAGGMSAIDVVLDLTRVTVLGVHALMNAPTSLVSSPAIDASVLVVLLTALLCLWPGRKKWVNPNSPGEHVTRGPRRETPTRTL